MKNKILLPLITVVDWIVFLAAAATVTVLSYEGLTRTAYPEALSVPVMLMDMAFLISVLLHLILRDKNRLLLYSNVFNLSLIITAYVMKFAGINYAPWMLLFWDIYLMLFYFMRNICCIRYGKEAQIQSGGNENGVYYKEMGEQRR